MKMEGKGVYTLIVYVKKESKLNIGKLRSINFTPGFYAYNGSALGNAGLRGRVNRHLKKIKKCFWHIDYLLRCKNSTIRAVVYTNTEKKQECLISIRLRKVKQADPVFKESS
jgi:Uri superfamily endonuclease